MPKILYSRVIEEEPKELKELEKRHRYTHLFQRVRMLRLLEAARALGYSWRQCQRWFASYRKGGLEGLLRSRVSERGRQELVTLEAFEALEEAMILPRPILYYTEAAVLRLAWRPSGLRDRVRRQGADAGARRPGVRSARQRNV